MSDREHITVIGYDPDSIVGAPRGDENEVRVWVDFLLSRPVPARAKEIAARVIQPGYDESESVELAHKRGVHTFNGDLGDRVRVNSAVNRLQDWAREIGTRVRQLDEELHRADRTEAAARQAAISTLDTVDFDSI